MVSEKTPNASSTWADQIHRLQLFTLQLQRAQNNITSTGQPNHPTRKLNHIFRIIHRRICIRKRAPAPNQNGYHMLIFPLRRPHDTKFDMHIKMQSRPCFPTLLIADHHQAFHHPADQVTHQIQAACSYSGELGIPEKRVVFATAPDPYS